MALKIKKKLTYLMSSILVHAPIRLIWRKFLVAKLILKRLCFTDGYCQHQNLNNYEIQLKYKVVDVLPNTRWNLTCTFKSLPYWPFGNPAISWYWNENFIVFFCSSLVAVNPADLPHRSCMFPLAFTVAKRLWVFFALKMYGICIDTGVWLSFQERVL